MVTQSSEGSIGTEKKKREKKANVKFSDQTELDDVTVLVLPPLALSNEMYTKI